MHRLHRLQKEGNVRRSGPSARNAVLSPPAALFKHRRLRRRTQRQCGVLERQWDTTSSCRPLAKDPPTRRRLGRLACFLGAMQAARGRLRRLLGTGKRETATAVSREKLAWLRLFCSPGLGGQWRIKIHVAGERRLLWPREGTWWRRLGCTYSVSRSESRCAAVEFAHASASSL